MNNDLEVLKLLLDGSNQIIMVNDVETFSMLYANATAISYAGRDGEPYEGRKCYEYIMKKDHPCPFCPLFKRRGEEELDIEENKGHEVFAFKTKFINWHGRNVFIEYAYNMEEELSLNKEIKLTNKLNEALACEYGTIFMLNLHNGTMRIRKMSQTQNAKKLNLPEVLPFDTFFKQYAENFIVQEDVEDVINTINVANLRRRVDNGDFNINIRYKVKPNAVGEENFEAVVLPVTTDDHYHMVVGVKCIDNLIAREEADKKILRESRAQAEAANKAKTSFLFNMSHDIRTPMNAIMGFTNLLEKHQEDPERRKDYLKKISDSSRILLSIINNVLEMARIEKGTIELDESAWGAQQFNDSIVTIFSDMMNDKNIEFIREIDIQHKYVMCDPIKLREVFINIISNAYKYTPKGGHIHMKLEELPSDKEGYVLYKTTLTDNGCGMSKEFLPHIFDEFAREKNTTQSKIEGTGLGMPIVKRLVEIMGGTINVESELGVGTTVTIVLPHKIAEKTNLVNHFGVEIDPKIINGKRILLAEDNDLNAEIAIEILNEAGFKVEHAHDGLQCVNMLEHADENYFDLIIMDIQMPIMNGYEAARNIRVLGNKTKASIPIIAMTANAFEEDRREAITSGMNAHIAKPIDVTELIKAIANNL